MASATACSSSTTTHTICGCGFKSKDDTCSPLDNVVLEIRHLHARHHSQLGAFAPVLKLYSDFVFEAATTRQMCARMGVGVQFSGLYAHHMLGKAERPWRTIRDNASAMLHNIVVPNFMWSCAVSTIVYVRNRTYSARSASPVASHSLSLRRPRETPPSSASSGSPFSPRCPTSCVGNSAKKRFVASWLATRLTP
jgi:hypothetical protein